VVGDGSRRAEVQALATAGPSAVTWIPYHSSPNELASLYRAADLFVHPGVQETFGLVALEAQACGTPVLGFRGTAMDEIIVEGTADWAEQQTAEALVRALDGAVQRDLNSRRDTIAQAVRERHSWQRAFERLFSIYEQVRSDYTDRRGHGRRQTIHDSQLPGV
jgi:alpha-1,6-mannosyltransferase